MEEHNFCLSRTDRREEDKRIRGEALTLYHEPATLPIVFSETRSDSPLCNNFILSCEPYSILSGSFLAALTWLLITEKGMEEGVFFLVAYLWVCISLGTYIVRYVLHGHSSSAASEA